MSRLVEWTVEKKAKLWIIFIGGVVFVAFFLKKNKFDFGKIILKFHFVITSN